MVKSNLSFSLIEILVVTAIIAVVTSMGYANFHRQQSDQQLKVETRRMADMISLARKKAMVSDTSDCSIGLYANDKINRYIFSLEPNNKTYTIKPDCVANSSPREITYTIQSSDISIISPANDTNIFFYSHLTETIPIMINIKNFVTNRCCRINIKSAGIIKEIPCEECDP